MSTNGFSQRPLNDPFSLYTFPKCVVKSRLSCLYNKRANSKGDTKDGIPYFLGMYPLEVNMIVCLFSSVHQGAAISETNHSLTLFLIKQLRALSWSH